jgi:hypothetical protein
MLKELSELIKVEGASETGELQCNGILSVGLYLEV